LFGGKDIKYSVLFNSRNIRRKQVPDTILAFAQFVEKLTPEQRKECALILHTEQVSEAWYRFRLLLLRLLSQRL
jgi:hypothetical protein